MKNKLFALIFLALLIGCGTPTPPAPAPVPVPPVPTPTPIPVPPVATVFEIQGVKLYVKGEMKPNPKQPIGEVKAAIMSAVSQLEPK